MTEAVMPSTGQGAYRAGVAVLILTSFLIVWTTIVRDDGNAAGQFMIILASGVGAFAARFRAEGMARAMVGIACMQVVLGALTATAPITAAIADGIFKAVLYNGIASALWLVSAAFFQIAAKRST